MARFPFFRQLDAMDCGPACLRMICKYHGRAFSAQSLRRRARIDRGGVSLLGLGDAAESVGMHSLAVSLPYETLAEAPLPCIAHWNQNHFVVVYRADARKVTVGDPGIGVVTYSRAEFLKGWGSINGREGVCLLVEPTPDFHALDGDEPPDKQNFRFLFSYLSPHRRMLVQLFLGLLIGGAFQLVAPLLTQTLVDVAIKNREIGLVHMILAGQLVLFISRTVIEVIRGWILLHVGTRINISIISDFLVKLIRNSPFAAKRKSLEAQLANKRSIREILTRQRNLAVRELELVDRKREMYGKLRTDGLVSDEQLIGLESERTAKRAALAGMENSLLQNEIGISEYETNAADLERQAQERRTTLLTAVRAGFEDLRNELAGWEDRYVLRSPTSGHVSRVAWADGQHVNSGDEVFVVVPNSTELIGWVQLPQAAAGPVKVGQTVRIEFDNFPRADFGCVTALVEAVSLIPREEKYQVRVGFPRGMLTDLGKQIDFRQEMQGNAEVVVEKGRLSDRLTSSFRALF